VKRIKPTKSDAVDEGAGLSTVKMCDQSQCSLSHVEDSETVKSTTHLSLVLLLGLTDSGDGDRHESRQYKADE